MVVLLEPVGFDVEHEPLVDVEQAADLVGIVSYRIHVEHLLTDSIRRIRAHFVSFSITYNTTASLSNASGFAAVTLINFHPSSVRH